MESSCTCMTWSSSCLRSLQLLVLLWLLSMLLFVCIPILDCDRRLLYACCLYKLPFFNCKLSFMWLDSRFPLVLLLVYINYYGTIVSSFFESVLLFYRLSHWWFLSCPNILPVWLFCLYSNVDFPNCHRCKL